MILHLYCVSRFLCSKDRPIWKKNIFIVLSLSNDSWTMSLLQCDPQYSYDRRYFNLCVCYHTAIFVNSRHCMSKKSEIRCNQLEAITWWSCMTLYVKVTWPAQRTFPILATMTARITIFFRFLGFCHWIHQHKNQMRTICTLTCVSQWSRGHTIDLSYYIARCKVWSVRLKCRYTKLFQVFISFVRIRRSQTITIACNDIWLHERSWFINPNSNAWDQDNPQPYNHVDPDVLSPTRSGLNPTRLFVVELICPEPNLSYETRKRSWLERS